MHYSVIIFFLLITFSLSQASDTLSTELKTIEVISDKFSNQFLVGVNPTIIKIPENQSYPQLSDILSTTSSIHIKDYGGLGGMKTVSLHGANSQQTVIAIDGVALNSSSNSSIDLARIPFDLFSKVEVVNTGISTKYGSSCIGGVVNLVSSDNFNHEKVVIKSSIGSFGQKTLGLSSSLVDFKIPIKFSINYIDYLGDYSFKYNNFGDIVDTNRKNNMYNAFNLSFNISKSFKESYLAISGYFQNSKKGLPGAVIIGKLEDSKTFFSDNSFILISSFIKQISSESFLSIKNLTSISNSELNNFQSYTDINYSYNSFQSKVITEYNKKIQEYLIYISNEIDYNRLTGYFLQPEMNNKVERLQTAVTSGINRIWDYDEFDIDFSMNGRYDYYSNMKKSAFSYFVGTEINDKVKNFGLNLSYSHNFRAPSFNEMYYLNYGNTQLVPETSNSLMIGIKYLPLSFLDLYISGFYINIKNQIVSIPKNPLMWTAQNFGKVQNIGVDAQLKYSLPKNFLDLTMSYTYQQPIDKFVSSLNYNKLLPFVSEEKLNLSMNSEIRNFYFSTQIMYNSFCFSQPDNSLNSIIHSFLNFDCSIGYKFSLDISEYITNIQIKNITNKVNYIIPYYPLAGRHYILNFIWKYL